MLYHLIETLSIDSARVASELHEDGSPHLHVYLYKADAVRTKNEKVFDYYGFHPNIQPCRKTSDVLTYIAKGGNYIDYGVLDAGSQKRTWNDMLLAQNAQEAKNFAKEHFPRDYILNHEKIEYFVNKHFKPEMPAYLPDPQQLFDLTIYPDLTTFTTQRLDEGNQTPPAPASGGAYSYNALDWHGANFF